MRLLGTYNSQIEFWYDSGNNIVIIVRDEYKAELRRIKIPIHVFHNIIREYLYFVEDRVR